MTLGHRALSASALARLGGIGDEADFLGAGLLQQHHAGDDAPYGTLWSAFTSTGVFGSRRSTADTRCDDGVLVDRRFFVLADS